MLHDGSVLIPGTAVEKYSSDYSVSIMSGRYINGSGPFEIHSRFCRNAFHARIDIVYEGNRGELVLETFTKNPLNSLHELGRALKLAGDEPRRVASEGNMSIRSVAP